MTTPNELMRLGSPEADADPPQKVAVSEDELRLAFAGPAFYANKMYATGMGQGVRISFMEQVGDAVSPQFRTAVFLSYSDAVALRDLLTRQLGAAVEIAIEIGPDGKPVIKSHGNQAEG